MKKDNRKIIIPLLLLLLLLGLGGTVAWLTSTDELVNSFTVGEITSPTEDPTDPTQTISISGNLYEPSWDSSVNHKLMPGVTYAKDPYVGIGDGSEESVVYVYVKNDFSNKIYFTINSGWTAVTGHVTAGSAASTYTSGLFKYNTNLDASSGDAWTSTPLFSSIQVANDANTADFTPSGATYDITVKCLVHQAKDANNNPISASDIEAAAIATLES